MAFKGNLNMDPVLQIKMFLSQQLAQKSFEQKALDKFLEVNMLLSEAMALTSKDKMASLLRVNFLLYETIATNPKQDEMNLLLKIESQLAGAMAQLSKESKCMEATPERCSEEKQPSCEAKLPVPVASEEEANVGSKSAAFVQKCSDEGSKNAYKHFEESAAISPDKKASVQEKNLGKEVATTQEQLVGKVKALPTHVTQVVITERSQSEVKKRPSIVQEFKDNIASIVTSNSKTGVVPSNVPMTSIAHQTKPANVQVKVSGNAKSAENGRSPALFATDELDSVTKPTQIDTGSSAVVQEKLVDNQEIKTSVTSEYSANVLKPEKDKKGKTRVMLPQSDQNGFTDMQEISANLQEKKKVVGTPLLEKLKEKTRLESEKKQANSQYAHLPSIKLFQGRARATQWMKD